MRKKWLRRLHLTIGAVLPIFLFACPLSLWGRFLQPPGSQLPEIVSFTGYTHVCVSYKACATFTWKTRYAQRVRLESGTIDDHGAFHPGGWHRNDDLPANGSEMFQLKIDNSAARLCVVAPATTRPVCAICDPFSPNTCR